MDCRSLSHAIRASVWLALCLGLWACAPHPPQPSPGHLKVDQPPRDAAEIPPPVQGLPYLPPPQPSAPEELYTVVVDKVPVDELLFALARDAKKNVDIHPDLQGLVTLNAVDQTLGQILERIARQVDLRYQVEADNLIIGPDKPYVRHYRVNYVNLERKSEHTTTVSTQLATSGDIGESSANTENNSDSNIKSVSSQMFWGNLALAINSILTPDGAEGTTTSVGDEKNLRPGLVINREAGVISVRATDRKQWEVQRFLDEIQQSVERQVLVEATIVEVVLGNQYQSGVDWQRITGNYGYFQSMSNSRMDRPPFYAFTYQDTTSKIGDIALSLKLLEQFGQVRVLSSPKIMALNNQSAILRVVENRVYFTVDVEETEGGTNKADKVTYTSKINTVPEGIIVTVTPQISENGMVIMNIRPTISRITNYISDPNPALAQFEIVNNIPEVEIREVETVLRLQSGNIAIIGGLMQDKIRKDRNGIPGLSGLPLVGDAFSYRDDQFTKTELAIFLRPLVVNNPSLDHNLQDYRRFLPQSGMNPNPPNTSIDFNPERLYH